MRSRPKIYETDETQKSLGNFLGANCCIRCAMQPWLTMSDIDSNFAIMKKAEKGV